MPTQPEPGRIFLPRVTLEEWRSRLGALARDDRTVIARLIATSEVIHRATAGHSMPRIPVWHRHGMVVIGAA